MSHWEPMTTLTPLRPGDPPPAAASPADLVLRHGAQSGRLIHVEYMAGREGRRVPWPASGACRGDRGVFRAGRARAVGAPGGHGRAGPGRPECDHRHRARIGQVAWLPAAGAGRDPRGGPRCTSRRPARWPPTSCDGLPLGAPASARRGGRRHPGRRRDWARQANYLLTTPDMLHQSLLPRHASWDGFFRRLRYVMVDECHAYRGVFGSHVAQVLRRLRRVAARPTKVARTKITLPPPVDSSSPRPRSANRKPVPRLPHRPGSGGGHGRTGPRAARWTLGLWEPPLLNPSPLESGLRGERGAPVRRTATAEAAELLASLVGGGDRGPWRSSGPAAAPEAVALGARRILWREPARRGLAGGWPPTGRAICREERRALEDALRAGRSPGSPPPRRWSWGQRRRAGRGPDRGLARNQGRTVAAGRARGPGGARRGRRADRPGRPAGYLPRAPSRGAAGRPVEATVLDPDNTYVLAPHLCAAAAELPLTEADWAFGPGNRARGGPGGPRAARHPAARLALDAGEAAGGTGLRATGGLPVRIVEGAGGSSARSTSRQPISSRTPARSISTRGVYLVTRAGPGGPGGAGRGG